MEDAAYFLKTMRAQHSVPEAVPVITLGGSYGGQVAAWLRAAKPDVFAAGISSSGPLNYVMATPQCTKTSDQCHEGVSAAARAGGASCPSTIRAGLDEIERLGKSKAERAELGERLKLCDGRDAIVNKASAMVLSGYLYDNSFPVYAQYDNSPPRYGLVESACKVAAAAAAAALGDALAPLAALAAWDAIFLEYDKNSECYKWDASGAALVQDLSGEDVYYLGDNLYNYQSCANGVVSSQFLSRKADADDLCTSGRVTKAELKNDCRAVYGKSVSVKPAPFMAKGPMLICSVGGVVFTNGELDPWAGGSPRSLVDLAPDAKAAAGIEYVFYPGASQCSDLIWYDPLEPSGTPDLRKKALDSASEYAEVWRAARM
ncbi:MAG: peptidase S28 [Monoraphidium minutum]|nr:MAG: peptidase S28 [Monoraphidium minutum]